MGKTLRLPNRSWEQKMKESRVGAEPLVCYHIEDAVGRFMCDDKHADPANCTWWGVFEDPFCCTFDTAKDARKWLTPDRRLRVSVDGKLC